MAKSASGYSTIAITGDGVLTNLVITLPTNATSPFQHLLVVLTTGANTLTPPSTTLFAVIIPPSGSVVAKTLKGVTGDTGVPLALAQPSIISLAATPGTFVINAASGETIDVYYL